MQDRRLSEEEARRLWERAARLHAESAAKELTAGEGDSEAESPESADRSDYSVDVVVRSAVEAGIPAEYVRRALEEMSPDGEPLGKVDVWADRYLGEGGRTLRVARTVDGSVDAVYAALQRVFPNAPYQLTLTSTDGRDPRSGGRLTFEVPTYAGFAGAGASSKAVMQVRHWADIRELHVRLLPKPPEGEGMPERTEVELFANLAHTRRVNFWAGNGVAGAVGLVTAMLTGAITSSIIDPVVAAELLTTFGAAGAAGVGSFLGLGRAWRPVYRYGIGKGREGMGKLIDALVVDLQTGGAFTSKDPKPVQEGTGVNDMLKQLGL